ncbi:MAG: HEAT repeat domain-containing protein [Terriglobia bacterium]
MTGKRRFEEQLAALEQLRHAPPQASIKPLRKALIHRNNYIVAKAADLVREFRLPELVPELLAAFDRFFVNPVKTDPQCWAKNAISRALAALDLQEAAVFLRGMRHIQLEPVWGGQSDTAATLRATCALALVPCRSLPETELLTYLIELFADKEKSVRVEAVRAVEQVGSPSAGLLLRLKATLGTDEPEVLGACYNGVLGIDGTAAIPWISRFLAAADDAAAEAALAIGANRSPQAFAALHERFLQEHDPWFQGVLLSAIGLTRQQTGLDFLLGLVRTESPHAEAAIEAILRSMPSAEIIAQLESMVSGNPRLARAFAAHRAATS